MDSTTGSAAPPFDLRPADASDLELCYRITENAMRGYVEATWGGWVEAEQRAKHTANFTPETHRIVRLHGQDIGLLAVEVHADHVWLVKVYLLDHARQQGIGRALVRMVLQEARMLDKPMQLRVLRVNTRARKLYESLGLRVVEQTDERFFMLSS